MTTAELGNGKTTKSNVGFYFESKKLRYLICRFSASFRMAFGMQSLLDQRTVCPAFSLGVLSPVLA